MTDLSGFADAQPTGGVLPPTLTKVGKMPKGYNLIFNSYNHDECELHNLNNRSRSKAFVTRLRELTNHTHDTISDLLRDTVNPNGEYKSLFKGLEPDVQLYEIGFAGKGRIFCYFVDKYCCVVSVCLRHRETNKTRR